MKRLLLDSLYWPQLYSCPATDRRRGSRGGGGGAWWRWWRRSPFRWRAVEVVAAAGQNCR